jgi:peptidoglycan L-alanyl-D-glutamate endopeptidase CwlK
MSRDMNLLRSDVAANCRKLIELAADAGWKVLVTCTTRTDAEQLEAYNSGHSNAKTPSFHAQHAGLAFDICQNIKGHEYDNNAFWAFTSKLGRAMGFTWGGDWKSIVDKPHFQWDEHGKYTGDMVRARKYPPMMPLHQQEDDDMTIDDIRKDLTTVSDTGDKHSDWAGAAVYKMTETGIFNGDGNGNYGWGQLLTREAAAKVLYNLLEKLDLLDQLR